jgi:hypothetical protein
MHTKDKLAAELRKIGLTDTIGVAGPLLFAMADKAAEGYYHDFLSPLDFPEMQLCADLALVGTHDALMLRQRCINGEFDATKEESDEWATSAEGKEAFNRLVQPSMKMGRLAMRVENRYWNAYYALPGTMEGAVLLGSIQMKFVEDKQRKELFMALMRSAVSDIIEQLTGERPVWPEEPQPAR